MNKSPLFFVKHTLIKDLDILENGTAVTWSSYTKHFLIDQGNQRKDFDKKKRELKIKLESEDASINSLSGGNQQKVVLSKWLLANPKVLILDHPTQGVDVGAKEDIYDIILDLAEQNMTIIVLSSEAQEIMRICDRTIVMYHGEMKGELDMCHMTEENIMRLATGGNIE